MEKTFESNEPTTALYVHWDPVVGSRLARDVGVFNVFQICDISNNFYTQVYVHVIYLHKDVKMTPIVYIYFVDRSTSSSISVVQKL